MSLLRRQPSLPAPLALIPITLLLTLPAPSPAATLPRVDTVNPQAGREGDTVDIQGEGFAPLPEDDAVFVDAGDSGTVLAVEGASGTTIEARIGPVPAAETGTLVVWTGDGLALPDAMLERQGRVYRISGASWFMAEAETRSVAFTLLEVSPGTVVSGAAPPLLILTVEPVEEGPSFNVDAKVVITDEEEPPASGDGGDDLRLAPSPGAASAPGAEGILATLHLDHVATTPVPPDAAAFAGDLAAALEQTFGPLGLHARADGDRVILEPPAGFRGEFAVMRTAP